MWLDTWKKNYSAFHIQSIAYKWSDQFLYEMYYHYLKSSSYECKIYLSQHVMQKMTKITMSFDAI